MASAQVQGAVQFNDKEKAAIAEAVKEAQNHLENNNAKARQENLALVTGVVKNAQNRPLQLYQTHSWKGHFLAEPSKIMGQTSAFVHQGATSQGHLPVIVGSKGAMVCVTLDNMYPGLGFLLAWDKPDKSSAVKVYVEAGNSNRFAKMDWNEVQAKLDASHSQSRYWDRETGAAAAAEITNYGENLALVGAMFDRFHA